MNHPIPQEAGQALNKLGNHLPLHFGWVLLLEKIEENSGQSQPLALVLKSMVNLQKSKRITNLTM